MKIRKGLLAAAALLALVLQVPASGYGQSDPQGRAMLKRAEQVKAMKNAFVVRALKAHGIQYRVNESGDVSMIQVNGRWTGVSQVEVVPNLLRRWGKTVVVGHTLYFLSDSGWLSIYMTGTAW